MKKPKIQKTTYTLMTEVGEVRVIWEPNGPAEINGIFYKTTWIITVEKDRLRGASTEYQCWKSRASATNRNAIHYAYHFVAMIKGQTIDQ